MKKNPLMKLLQNKMILAALLTILVAGTAAAGMIALRGEEPEQATEETKPGYVSETKEAEENEQLVHLEEDLQGLQNLEQLQQQVADREKTETMEAERPVQSDRIDTELSGSKTDAELSVGNQDAETLVDGGNAVVYDPEKEEEQPEDLPALSFAVGDTISWPVHGNIILDYSMDTTIYFPTLEQYKCNPGIMIQAEVGQPVAAAARGVVTAIGTNEELGNFIMMDLSDEYSIMYGQLENIAVSIGQLVETGDVLGVVAAPTKYYVVEGPNIYLELRCRQKPVDPLDYIR